MTHRTPISVRFSEVDPYRHVNHAVYIVYFEEGRTAALAAAGLDLGGANLRGADLRRADLSDANLAGGMFGNRRQP